MKIIKLKRKYHESFFKIVQENNKFYYAKSKISLLNIKKYYSQYIFKRPTNISILIIINEYDQLVGFASFIFLDSLTEFSRFNRRICQLNDLFISKKFRNNNFGKKLLEKIILISKKNKCNRIEFKVKSKKKSTIEFYQKIGAINDNLQKNYVLNI